MEKKKKKKARTKKCMRSVFAHIHSADSSILSQKGVSAEPLEPPLSPPLISGDCRET